MKQKNILRQKFSFAYNKKTIEVMLFIDIKPYELLVGVHRTSCSFMVLVSANGEVKNWIDNYNELCNALEINHFSSSEKLTPSIIFGLIDNNSPRLAVLKAIPKPQDRFIYDKDIEEADKIYFIGYRDNSKCGGHVTQPNYIKSLKAYGSKVAQYLKTKNISTRWTNVPEDEVDFFLPKDK